MAYCIIQTDTCKSTKNIDPKLNPFLAALFRKFFLIIFNKHFLFADFCRDIPNKPCPFSPHSVLLSCQLGSHFPRNPAQSSSSSVRACPVVCQGSGSAQHEESSAHTAGEGNAAVAHSTARPGKKQHWELLLDPQQKLNHPSCCLLHRTAFSCPDLTSIFPEPLYKFITY